MSSTIPPDEVVPTPVSPSMSTSPATSMSTSTARLRTRLLGVVAATLAALTVWVVADLLADVDLTVDAGSGSGSQTVGPVAVAVAALLVGLAGWGLLAVLERITRRARTVWVVVATAVAVLSLAGPLGTTGSTEARMALAAMHLAVAAVLIPVLFRSAARRSKS